MLERERERMNLVAYRPELERQSPGDTQIANTNAPVILILLQLRRTLVLTSDLAMDRGMMAIGATIPPALWTPIACEVDRHTMEQYKCSRDLDIKL